MWLKNLNIWDGESDELIAANAIKIDHNEIAAITDSSVQVEEDEQVHDLQGLYCIPGLIDAHVHMCLNPVLKDPLEQDKPNDAVIISEMTERAEQMLAAGITTARDLGG
ncbi:MAG: amidohydrolase family protein, partial [Pseudomonadales bacterium]|nr:amidohydrolase family protein [Pseudomonadales bacterium]